MAPGKRRGVRIRQCVSLSRTGQCCHRRPCLAPVSLGAIATWITISRSGGGHWPTPGHSSSPCCVCVPPQLSAWAACSRAHHFVPVHVTGSVSHTMPKGRERAGVRGHGGQRGERGSYRNAWAEGDYSRQGAGSDSDEDAAHTPNVGARLVYWERVAITCLASLRLDTLAPISHRTHKEDTCRGARQRRCACVARSEPCPAERAGGLPQTAPCCEGAEVESVQLAVPGSA
jgi:hypothetical protein